MYTWWCERICDRLRDTSAQVWRINGTELTSRQTVTLYCMNTSIFLFTASAARGQGMKKLCSNCRRFEGTVSIFSRKSLSVRQTRPSFVRTRATIRRIGGGLVSPRLLLESSYRSYLRYERRKHWKASSLENKFYASWHRSWIVQWQREHASLVFSVLYFI